MATTLQLRRGTSTEADAVTGSSGELFVDLTDKNIRILDGVTSGGTKLASETYVSNTCYTKSEIDTMTGDIESTLETYVSNTCYTKSEIDTMTGDLS